MRERCPLALCLGLAPAALNYQARSGRRQRRLCYRRCESVIMIYSEYLAISVQQKGTTCVLQLRGELDVCSRESLRAAISSAFKRCPEILVLDLSALEFIDCSGLSVLMWAHHVLAANCGQLLVTGCPLAAGRLIRLTGADQHLHLCPAPPLHAGCRGAGVPASASAYVLVKGCVQAG
jgi:anti-sigma B factor antagonist